MKNISEVSLHQPRPQPSPWFRSLTNQDGRVLALTFFVYILQMVTRLNGGGSLAQRVIIKGFHGKALGKWRGTPNIIRQEYILSPPVESAKMALSFTPRTINRRFHPRAKKCSFPTCLLLGYSSQDTEYFLVLFNSPPFIRFSSYINLVVVVKSVTVACRVNQSRNIPLVKAMVHHLPHTFFTYFLVMKEYLSQKEPN